MLPQIIVRRVKGITFKSLQLFARRASDGMLWSGFLSGNNKIQYPADPLLAARLLFKFSRIFRIIISKLSSPEATTVSKIFGDSILCVLFPPIICHLPATTMQRDENECVNKCFNCSHH